MPATPFSRAPEQDVTQRAALEGIRDRAVQAQPATQPSAAPAQAQPAGGNQVAALLAQALDLIVNSPPEMLEINLMQVEQFIGALQQLAQGVPGVAQQGAAPGQPLPPAGGLPVGGAPGQPV
jgi:hypothetical protein